MSRISTSRNFRNVTSFPPRRVSLCKLSDWPKVALVEGTVVSFGS